jgi:hypothetical protein
MISFNVMILATVQIRKQKAQQEQNNKTPRSLKSLFGMNI